MTQVPSNGLKLMTLFIAGSMLLGSMTGCGVYKDWKQKEETRLMQTAREATIRELAEKKAERKAEKEANKNWLQKHWAGVSIGTLATWAIGITTFMILKWPKGIAGPQGPQGIPGIAGKDGRKVYFSIQQNEEVISKLEEAVSRQGKAAIDEVRELAQAANTSVGTVISVNDFLSHGLDSLSKRIVDLEKAVGKLQEVPLTVNGI